MSIGQRKVYVALCLCLVTPAAALAATLCATDDFTNIVALKTDSDFTAGAIVGLHGWLSNGTTTTPMHGTAVVDSAAATVKIVIQGINAVRHQYVGVVIDANLMLDGSGTFENLNPGRPFTYDITPVRWTPLATCPEAPPSTP
jgi:hypothetical protein